MTALTPVLLGVITVVLGGLAVWFALEAQSLRGGGAAQNTAVTNQATTVQVTRQVTSALEKVFTYDYTNMATARQQAQHLLTGNAVRQYNTLVAPVQQQAQAQKLSVTTTVIQSGVELLQGNRARVLIFADQHYAVIKESGYSATMIAVDAVRQNGTWKIDNIQTFGTT